MNPRTVPELQGWSIGARSWRVGVIFVLVIAVLSGCNRRVLLDERFHDTRLINWSVVDEEDTLEGPSRWSVEQDGWLHQNSNIWGRRGDFIGRWYGTLLVAGSADWTDYGLSVRARPLDDDGFGIVFRYQDPEHFYRLILVQDGMSGGPVTRLDRREGADYTELWSNEKGYRVGSEMQIAIEVKGTTIVGRLDGHSLFEITDSRYANGRIGVFCYAQNGQAFDDVLVIGR